MKTNKLKKLFNFYLTFLLVFHVYCGVVNMDWSEILIKNGNTQPDSNHPRHRLEFNDGQIGAIRPAGYYKGKITHKHNIILLVPGKYDTKDLNIKKLLTGVDKNGKYSWEPFYDSEGKNVRKRDWLIDLTDLLQKGILTPAQLNALYNKDVSMAAIPINLNLFDIIKHEDGYTRKDLSRLFSPGSVAQGTYTVGGDLPDYDGWDDAELDLAATLTGDIFFEHKSFLSTLTTEVIWSVNTSSFSLNLRCVTGAKHNGTWGNGARTSMGTFDGFRLDGANLNSVNISKLAFDISGNSNKVIEARTSDNVYANRLLIKANADSTAPIATQSGSDLLDVRNCIIYDATTSTGIYFILSGVAKTARAINNTIVNCNVGVNIANAQGTGFVKNNLCQFNNTDFLGTGNYDQHAGNISKDNSSPQVGLRNLDKTGKMVNYGGDDFKLASIDSHLIQAENLGANFRDDVNHDAPWRPAAGVGDWHVGASQVPIAVVGGSAHTAFRNV